MSAVWTKRYGRTLGSPNAPLHLEPHIHPATPQSHALVGHIPEFRPNPSRSMKRKSPAHPASDWLRIKSLSRVVSLALLVPQITFVETLRGSFRFDHRFATSLFLTGEIRAGDTLELRTALRESAIQIVVMGSAGGNLYEGLQMGAICPARNASAAAICAAKAAGSRRARVPCRAAKKRPTLLALR